MKAMNEQSRGRRVIWVILFCLPSLFSNAQILSEPSPAELRRYYTFLEALAADTAADKIEPVKKYLAENGDFERVYIYLLEHFLIEGRSAEAKAYFNNLLADPRYRRNSSWALARIFTMEDSSVLAYRAFQEALKSGEPTFLLLNDFIQFLDQSEGEDSGLKEIERLNLPPPLDALAEAIWNREQLNFPGVIESFQKLPREYTRNEFVLHLWGFSHSMISDDSLAYSFFRRGLELARENDDWQFESYYLTSMALDLRAQLGDKETLRYCDEGRSIAQKIDDLMLLEFAEGALGTCYMQQKKYALALEQFNRAIEIALPLGLYGSVARNCLEKARLFLEEGNLNQVLEELERGELFVQKAGSLNTMFALQLEKAGFYAFLHLNDFAEYEYRKVSDWARAHRHKGLEYRAASGLVSPLLDEGKYTEARKLYAEMLNLPLNMVREDYRAYWKFMAGDCYYRGKDFDNAFIEFSGALDLAQKAPKTVYTEYLQANSRLRIASIEIEKGNIPRAMEICSEDMVARVAEEDSSFAIELNFTLGNAFKAKGDLDKAIEYYSAAVDLIEEDRSELSVEELRIGYFSEMVAVYNSLIECYLKRYKEAGNRGDIEKLYSCLEMSRARALRDIRIDKASDGEKLKENPLYREYRQACDQLQFIQREIRLNPHIHDSLLIKYETARFNVLFARLKLIKKSALRNDISLDETVEALQQKELGALIYHISEEVSFLLSINNRNIDLIELHTDPQTLAAAIDSLLSPFHNATESSVGSIPFRAAIAHRLYQILIKPVEEKGLLSPNLMIVPDLTLGALPFDMLLREAPGKPEYLPTDPADYDGSFLLRRHSIFYSPGAWLSASAKDSSGVEPHILVMANPLADGNLATASLSRSNWRSSPLWYADSEGDSLKAIYSFVDIFKRGDATVANLERHYREYRILHFATHAFVDSAFAAFSGLALAPGMDSTDDGLLMGYKISDLNFNCDLVVLSACETGRGKAVAGEGVLGLPRLFMSAGANQVLMTLWKVRDEFSRSLMPEFYNNFLNRGMTKSRALREARETMLERSSENYYYRHPFFWAAFSLYGQPDFPGDDGMLYLEIFAGAFLFLVAGLFLVWAFRRRHQG